MVNKRVAVSVSSANEVTSFEDKSLNCIRKINAVFTGSSTKPIVNLCSFAYFSDSIAYGK